jgi:hypothetical protein
MVCLGSSNPQNYAHQWECEAHERVCCLCCCSYMEPVYASMGLIEEGRKMLLLDNLRSLQVKCPIRILHGVQVCCSCAHASQLPLQASSLVAELVLHFLAASPAETWWYPCLCMASASLLIVHEA